MREQARLACTTAWISNPDETVALLDEFEGHLSSHAHPQANGAND